MIRIFREANSLDFPFYTRKTPHLFERVISPNEYNQGGMNAELLTKKQN